MDSGTGANWRRQPRVARSLGITHHMVAKIDLRMFGGSALTADIEVPKGRDSRRMSSEIPITYVPARNTIFLSFALGWCEVLDAQDIFIGVNASRLFRVPGLQTGIPAGI